MIKRFLALPLVGAILTLSAPSASADTYTDTIVGQLNADHRVVVDRNADPALPDPEAINSEILPTGLPLYVVNIAKNQTNPRSMDSDGAVATLPIKNALYATHNPIANPITVNGQPHNAPLIILVIDGNGYHARGYDVTQSIADAAGPKIVQAAAEHRHNLQGTVSAYISAMASTPSTGPVVSNVPPPPPPPQPTNWAFLWAMLWVAVAAAVTTAAAFVVRFFYRGHQDKVARRDKVRNRINRVRADLELLAEEVLKGEDVSQANNRATSAVYDAETALKRDDIANAASYVGIAEEQIQQAYRGLSHEMTPHSHVGTFEDVRKHDRKKAKVTATSPKGNRVTIDNTDYRTQSASGYRNHLDRGGVYNGAYFNPGYYPYPFWGTGWGWSPTDVILMDEVLNDRHDYDDYSHHNYSHHSGGGSASIGGGDSGHHSGGGSAGFSPSYSPAPSRHHSSSSDSGTSSGGGSSGFGGGGFGGFGGGGGGDSSGGGSAGF